MTRTKRNLTLAGILFFSFGALITVLLITSINCSTNFQERTDTQNLREINSSRNPLPSLRPTPGPIMKLKELQI